ncbi:MAG: hypothetical protein NVSMB21_24320 [Vulcanimicrobiaceae bacterium]
MYTQTAAFYDTIQAARGKAYAREAAAVADAIRERTPAAATLLDVGCGTGAHLEAFGALGFTCRGIDLDLKMVALARSRLPEVEIGPGDMATLALGTTFDAVVSLFGTTAYARTSGHLDDAVARMAAHLAPGGTLVVEPFLAFGAYRPGVVDAVFVDDPDLKIARMSLSKQTGKIGILDYHYLVATLKGVERYFERHEVGLFDEAAYRTAFERAGLAFERVALPQSECGGGLYLGRALARGPNADAAAPF